MRIILTLLLIARTLVSDGQQSQKYYKIDSIICELPDSDKREITTNVLTFKFDIVDFSCNPIQPLLLVQEFKMNKKKTTPAFGNIGRTHAIDPFSLKHLWTFKEEGNPNHGWTFKLIGDNLYYKNTVNKYFRIDPATGKKISKYNFDLYYFDAFASILLGRKLGLDGFPQKKYSAISTANDSILWEKEYPGKFDYSEIILRTDSGIISHDRGIRYLNLYTGSSWNYDVPSVVDFSVSKSAQSFTNSISLLTGIHDNRLLSLWQINSNPVSADENIYISSKEKLICISSNGQEKRTIPLPADSTSYAYLHNSNDNLILINSGHAFFNWQPVPFGHPSYAVYDKPTFSLKYKYVFKRDSTEFIQDEFIKDSKIYVLYDNSIYMFNTDRNDQKIFQIAYSESKCVGFADEDIYINNDSSLLTQANNGDRYVYVTLANGDLYKFDTTGDNYTIIKNKNYYLMAGRHNNLQVLTNDIQTLITSLSGEPLAIFAKITNATLHKNLLLSVSFNKLYITDLNQITYP